MAPTISNFPASIGVHDYPFGYADHFFESKGVTTPDRVPEILLVDDDLIFCKRMEKAAMKRRVHLTVCNGVESLSELSKDATFDVALLDYYVGDVTAPEIIPTLKKRHLPIILISSSIPADLMDFEWLEPIEEFLPKAIGPDTILREAVNIAPMNLGGLDLLWSRTTMGIALLALILISLASFSFWNRMNQVFTIENPHSVAPPSNSHSKPVEKKNSGPGYRWDAAPMRNGVNSA